MIEIFLCFQNMTIGHQLAQSFEETLSTFEQSKYKDW